VAYIFKFEKEAEGFILACLNQGITTNAIKNNIFNLSGSASCRLCGNCQETVDHIIELQCNCSILL